jgi:hypothetical protein
MIVLLNGKDRIRARAGVAKRALSSGFLPKGQGAAARLRHRDVVG